MTKLATVRVVVPVDDDVRVDDLQRLLQGHLEERPVERVSDNGPRIHWSAVSVVRGAERVDRQSESVRKLPRKPAEPVKGAA